MAAGAAGHRGLRRRLLWLTTLSVLGQVIYNIEISRYTLYTGEPIFTGKFRTIPGPRFWVLAYLFLDLGSIFPYLAANAATPVATLLKGGIVPNPAADSGDFWLMKVLGYVIFLLALVPLLFGGKIYNSLRAVMTFKIVVVFGFLLFLAFFFSQPSTWVEILSGFFKFGTVPIQAAADARRAGRQRRQYICCTLRRARPAADGFHVSSRSSPHSPPSPVPEG